MTATVEVDFSSAESTGRGYPIHIGADLLSSLPSHFPDGVRAHRWVVISDSRVGPLYADRVRSGLESIGGDVDLLTFPEGEANKNRSSWLELSDGMLEKGIGRDAVVVALGGGVTGDLAGFVAATYLRGLPLIQLPTSLLAMIDSSVGGKTGVDTPAGKNLIGAFHQPVCVVADVEALRTLAPEHVRAGLAEAIKHGAISDREYFEWIAGNSGKLLSLDPAVVTELIRRSVAIKADVVSKDEKESGLRKTLNFGHTIGHAVEAASEFRFLHGEAIAIGMVLEARLGERLGITEEGTAELLEGCIAAFELPTRMPAEMAPQKILELTRLDKKARAGKVEYALLTELGSVSRGSGSYGTAVDDDDVLSVLRDR